MPSRQGAFRLFEFNGITVFLHWTWFVVAIYEIGGRTSTYSSMFWNALEYLGLFVIVTLHEFGHAFACRSVGGRADQIVLWPLGGVAYVAPPPRPGATLWSIAAGPLVNVVLLPVLALLSVVTSGPLESDVHALFRTISYMNIGLLLFNMLPVYPLDGGQILGALLWFVMGRARSLMVTAVIGLVGVAGLGWWALTSQSVWLGLIAFFLGSRCVSSFQAARVMSRGANLPRPAFACPSCHAQPTEGATLTCGECGTAFDLSDAAARGMMGSEENDAVDEPPAAALANTPVRCPKCATPIAGLKCPHCGAAGSIADWRTAAAVSSP
jgi:Zn-dependent protease